MARDELPEVRIGRHLRQAGLNLATAESCTGGLVSHRITNISGSSDYFIGGVVAYSNELKRVMLGVPAEVLEQHGAVSQETALCMARGVCRATGAQIGVSITGIAGPAGGSREKPVGLTYIALAAPEGEFCHRFLWMGDREANKHASAEAALRMIAGYLLGRRRRFQA